MDLLAEVARLKEKAFGIAEFTPESDIQICEFMGEFATGVAFYQTLSKPSPEDDRWAGLCYIVLGQQQRATEYLMRSVERGCLTAKMDLARLYSDSSPLEAEREIDGLLVENLRGYNLALYYRILSMLRYKTSILESVSLCEKSWRIIQVCEEFLFVAPRILLTLSNYCQITKRPEKAQYYMKRAEEICVTSNIWHIKLNHAYILYDLNRFEECELQCNDLLGAFDKRIHISSRILLAMTKLSVEESENALKILEKTSKDCLEIMSFYDYFIVQSYLCVIYFESGRIAQSNNSLREMERYAENELFKWKLNLRKISLKPSPNKDDLEMLDEMLEFRKKTGSIVEILRVLLHRSNALRKMGLLEEYKTSLDNIIEFCIENKSFNDCSEEWIFLKKMKKDIYRRHGNVFYDENKKIKVNTINSEYIELDEQIIKIPLRKTLELLVFMIIRKKCKIQDLVLEVFGESNRTKARNYFHQIRHVVNNKIGVLEIVYDKAGDFYYLKSKYDIDLDIINILEGKEKLEGYFMPSSNSEWVLDINAKYGSLINDI